MFGHCAHLRGRIRAAQTDRSFSFIFTCDVLSFSFALSLPGKTVCVCFKSLHRICIENLVLLAHTQIHTNKKKQYNLVVLANSNGCSGFLSTCFIVCKNTH